MNTIKRIHNCDKCGLLFNGQRDVAATVAISGPGLQPRVIELCKKCHEGIGL